MRDGALGRQTALDQVRGSWCLGDALGAGAAGILGPDGDDDADLRGNNIQPLGAIRADPVHLAAPAWAVQAVRLDHLLDPRQVLGQIAPVAPDRPARGRLRRSLFVLLGLDLGDCGLKILERQLPLVFAQLLRPFAMHGLVQLGNEVLQAFVGLPQRIPLAQHCQNSVTLVVTIRRRPRSLASLRS